MSDFRCTHFFSGPKQIFPMFIGLADGDIDRTSSDVARSGRIIMSKRLSMTSLTSLCSIDMTPTSEGLLLKKHGLILCIFVLEDLNRVANSKKVLFCRKGTT